MPSLGPDMESGTLVEWRIKVGDQVRRGQIVALVETDKGVIDVEVFAPGTVEEILVQPGAHVPVGTALALLSGETVSAPAPAGAATATPVSAAPAATPVAPAPVSAAPVSEPGQPTAHRQRVSPAARVRAHELGVDLASVIASGPNNTVTLEDVNRFAPAAAPSATPAAPEPVRDMRQVIAKAMSRSKREIPHYYLSLTCSFLAAQSWIERHNASASIEQRLLPPALLLKAVALAARSMSDFNGFYRDGEFSPAADVHVGMAIAMRGGRLVAPAILNADRKPLQAVMSELRDLTTRVRAGHMRATELALPTITLTSLAEEGMDLVVPAIYPPQVAIIGCGSILTRPWVIDGAVRPAPLITITLAADHRVTDGRAGARFLAHVRDLLGAPERL
jgi:pyruvate dehydrogenase E2 component (dihydrolipoyllysine-residue acetyltransferase)